jgi:hypothetical protein
MSWNRGKHRIGSGVPPPTAREAVWCQYVAGRLRGSPRLEVRLSDGSRCDILTSTHAWEVDFAKKWHEGISQAVLYGKLTGRRAGLILLVNPERDQAFLQRARRTLSQHRPEIRPVLFLCNIMNGRLESDTSRAEEAAILIPVDSAKSAGCLAGCGLLLLLGTCCLCLAPFLPPDSPEPAPVELAAPSVEHRRSAAESLPSTSSTREGHARSDSGRSREPVPVDPSQIRESRADAGGVAGKVEERVPKSPFRVWKDNSGQYSVQAEFVEFQDNRVQLRRLDGTVVSVDPERLSAEDRRHLETVFGVRFGVPVIGQVTVLSEKQPGICEIRFPTDVRVRAGDSVEVHRDGTLLGIFRVLAVHHRDVVVHHATLRPRVGDTAIFRSHSDFPAP